MKYRRKRGRPRKNVFGEYLETQATKTSQDLVADVDLLTKQLFKNLENPEGISQIVLELAVKNVGLGNYLIEALDQERNADTLYKWSVDGRKLELIEEGMTATKAESQAKVENQDLLTVLNVAHKAVDILKIKRTDTERVIEAARSRLSLIKADIRRAQ